MPDDQDTENTNFSQIRSGITDSGKQLGGAISAVKDDLADKAQDIAAEGKEALAGHAETAQKNLSTAIATFSGALRAASEHLANSDQRSASRFALEAAGGLEQMSASLKEKPFEDVLAEIRAFGAQNPGVLVGGSIIAGLALGRFLKSSSPTASASAKRSGGSSNDGSPSSGIHASDISEQESDR